MANDLFDAIILGAGPAGATAAILLSQNDRRVALIDSATFPRKGTNAGWLNTRAAPLLAELSVDVKKILQHTFSDVTFHNEDFSKSAKPKFDGAAGYLVDRNELDNALVKHAKSCGATILSEKKVREIQLGESAATACFEDDDKVEGRMLILAAGRASSLLDHVGISRGGSGSIIWSGQVNAPLPKSASKRESTVGVVLGLDRKGSFAMYCLSAKWASVTINWYGERGEVMPAFIHICRTLFEQNLLPENLSAQAAASPVVPCPASAALDMDSHVGKNTLVIGDAGGFVSAASNEGIYPAMWSAQIAAGVAHEALGIDHSQDALMTFNTQWRLQMADYLRSPNTDAQFLLPLIFSNQPMADRMGAAFFSGENI